MTEPIKRTVCVDVDGVLAEYHGWKGDEHLGEPLPGAVEFTRKLAERFRVVIHTTRANSDKGVLCLMKWLDVHGFAFDEIQPKPVAIAYIDDRALICTPQSNPDSFDQVLRASLIAAAFVKATEQVQSAEPEPERRAPVQADHPSEAPGGSISWTEHLEAWRAYDERFRSGQSAERIAERGGFGYAELVDLLGREPETWSPRETAPAESAPPPAVNSTPNQDH